MHDFCMVRCHDTFIRRTFRPEELISYIAVRFSYSCARNYGRLNRVKGHDVCN